MKILVIEDDALIAEHLRDILVDDCGDEVEMVYSAKDARIILGKEKFDLILLDINMEKPDIGVDVAKYINDEIQTPFIFITAQSDRKIVDRAILMNPSAYIIKPFSPVSVIVAVNVIRQQIVNDNFVFRDGYKDVIIPKNQILFGKACNNYIEIFGLKKKWVVRITMSNLMELLPNDQFVQIHRSFFVSTKNIEFITTSKLSVNGELLPISKGFEKNIKELVTQIKMK